MDNSIALLTATVSGILAFLIAKNIEASKGKQEKQKLDMVGGTDIEIEKTLYISVGKPFEIFIPKEDLNDDVDLHKLFQKYGITKININKFLNLNTLRSFSPEKIIPYSHISKLSKLFEEAKNILKEYLPNDNENYDDKTKWFQRKDEGLRRIFSHHYEKRLVLDNPKTYSQIKFPERKLIIKDSQGTRLSKNNTSTFIDNNFNIHLDYDGVIYFTLDSLNGYDIINCTTYIEERGQKESPASDNNYIANEQLRKLCQALGTVDYTALNVHFKGGIVWIKDLKNKGQNRCDDIYKKEEKEEKKSDSNWLDKFSTN